MITMKLTSMQCNEDSKNKKILSISMCLASMPKNCVTNITMVGNVFLSTTLGQSTLVININKIVVKPIEFFWHQVMQNVKICLNHVKKISLESICGPYNRISLVAFGINVWKIPPIITTIVVIINGNPYRCIFLMSDCKIRHFICTKCNSI